MSKRKQRMLALVAKALPIGKSVLYFPIDGEPNALLGVVSSRPWMLGHGEIVIKLNGRAGCVAVNHLELVGEP